jgi:hypothetical protein
MQLEEVVSEVYRSLGDCPVPDAEVQEAMGRLNCKRPQATRLVRMHAAMAKARLDPRVKHRATRVPVITGGRPTTAG